MNIDESDINNAGAQHWAASVNNAFLLKFFWKVGVDLSLLDKQGFSTLDIAISYYAYESIKFLVKVLPLTYLHKVNLLELKSKSMKNIIRKELARRDPGEAGLKLRFCSFYDRFRHTILITLYSLYALSMAMQLRYHKKMNFPERVSSDLIFLLLLIYLIMVLVVFLKMTFDKYTPNMLKTHKYFISDEYANTRAEHLREERLRPQPCMEGVELGSYKHLNWKHVNKLLACNGHASSADHEQIGMGAHAGASEEDWSDAADQQVNPARKLNFL